VLERSTLRMRSDRIPAQRPSAKGALVAVHAGQSPMCPIPIGRVTKSNSTISRTARITLITSGYCGATNTQQKLNANAPVDPVIAAARRPYDLFERIELPAPYGPALDLSVCESTPT